MPGRYFDEWKVGDRVEHSISRTVTETDNLLISTLTHNPQPLHIDHEAAAKTEFGKPLVNSVFTFGLMIGVSVNDTTLGTLVANLGYDKLVFPKPVFVGDTLRSESECIDLRESKSRPNAGHRHLGAPQLQPARRAGVRMHALRAAAEEVRMTEPRSWLFVPADSEKKIGKAIESEADAVIFDLEDSVAPAQKAAARQILKDLGKRSGGPQWWVRINPLRTDEHRKDLEMLGIAGIHGVVLPKAEGGADIAELAHRTGNIPIHAIVTETAASLFGMLSYRDPKSTLAAMSWGAEDLSAALGASSKYDADGSLSYTYKLARSLCLAGAVAAGVQPVDGVFADFRDDEGLRAEAEAAAREGFTGKLAIHPAQVGVINAAFTPSADEVAHARAIVEAFDAEPDAGVLSVGGRMVDRPHLVQAKRVLDRAK